MTEADEAVAWAAVERISLAIVAYGDLITRHNTEGTLLRNAVEQGALRAGHDKITARRAYAAAARAYSAWSGHGGRPEAPSVGPGVAAAPPAGRRGQGAGGSPSGQQRVGMPARDERRPDQR